MKSLWVFLGLFAVANAVSSPAEWIFRMKKQAKRLMELDWPITSHPCYDHFGNPRRCVPEFIRNPSGMSVHVSNTCGMNGPTEFCFPRNATIETERICGFCDAEEYSQARPSSYMTDGNAETYWQSETIYDGVPSQVNLTVHLGKAYDITYIMLSFMSPRPHSMAIYKKTSEDGPWEPYHYFSANCKDVYQKEDKIVVSAGQETEAMCESGSSGIHPLRGGDMAFSTLDGRPSAYEFDNRKDLQDWVTATDIRITLDKLNTFGDETSGDADALKSYFYAINGLFVAGRCKCNGHAAECVDRGMGRQTCVCHHNTAGPECEKCLPFFNDQPWGVATSDDARACQPCDCNGFSDRCYFDQQLFEATGHGGHCMYCSGNRDGPNCERCKENYVLNQDGSCVPGR